MDPPGPGSNASHLSTLPDPSLQNGTGYGGGVSDDGAPIFVVVVVVAIAMFLYPP